MQNSLKYVIFNTLFSHTCNRQQSVKDEKIKQPRGWVAFSLYKY